MIALEKVCFGYERTMLFDDLSCAMGDGRITALLGPNGSGKSTCLRLCAGLLKPSGGAITVGDSDISTLSPRMLAQRLAFLPQSRPTPMITVGALVANGRFPYLGISRRLSPADKDAVALALELTGLKDMAQRELRTLSGGERQKAYIAMLIAQGAQHILLDEPTTYLDIRHRLELMELLHSLRSHGRCIVLVLHDIDLAAEACDNAIVLSHGRIVHTGPASIIADSGAIELAYGVTPIKSAGMRFTAV